MTHHRDLWRVGRREGQNLWQIKQAPGWRVAHECATLAEADAWLTAQGVDTATIHVVSLRAFGTTDWPTLRDAALRSASEASAP